MSSWNGDIADEESATEALILQLIAEDFGISNREDQTDPAVDPEDESSGNEAVSSPDLDDIPIPRSRRGSVKSLDEPSFLEQPEEHTTITQPQGSSPSTTPSHLEHPTLIKQTSNPNVGNRSTMPKRNVEAAELPSYSVDDLETFDDHSTSSMPPMNHALSTRPGRTTNEKLQGNLQTSLTNPNKRPRVAGSSRSSSRQERPGYKDFVKYNQQVTSQDHDSDFAQHHQHITMGNNQDPHMQLDKSPSQPYPAAQRSADGAVTMNDRSDVRSELDGLQKLSNRYYNDHPETVPSRMQSRNTNDDQPRRAKEWKFHEEYPQSTAEMPHRPAESSRRDPFGSNHKEIPQQRGAQNTGRRHHVANHDAFGNNHKDHTTQQAAQGEIRTGQQRHVSDALVNEDGNDEGQRIKHQYPKNAISPDDGGWNKKARADVDANLGILESTIRYEGKVWIYIAVPWAGMPGWMESYVDDTSYEAFLDHGAGRGRPYRGPTLVQLEDNRRRKHGEQPVDIFVGEEETLDSIIRNMIKREKKEAKGKGKAV